MVQYAEFNSLHTYFVKCAGYKKYGAGGNGYVKGYKGEAIKAAKDLMYGEAVIKQIKRAKTENEVYMIMVQARLAGGRRG